MTETEAEAVVLDQEVPSHPPTYTMSLRPKLKPLSTRLLGSVTLLRFRNNQPTMPLLP